jgi:hypothetical protein
MERKLSFPTACDRARKMKNRSVLLKGAIMAAIEIAINLRPLQHVTWRYYLNN